MRRFVRSRSQNRETKRKWRSKKFIRASSLHLSKLSYVETTQCLARQSQRLREILRIFSVLCQLLPRGFMLLGLYITSWNMKTRVAWLVQIVEFSSVQGRHQGWKRVKTSNNYINKIVFETVFLCLNIYLTINAETFTHFHNTEMTVWLKPGSKF